MKTVLFVDKGEGELWHSFQRYDFVLDEYRRQGHFAVCDWHAAGTSVATAIPTLPAILGDEAEWTAVIACDLRVPEGSWEGDVHYDNPFDFDLNYEKDPHAAVHDSADAPALVRLTQMLGGIPEKADLVGRKLEYRRPESFYQMLDDYRLGVPRPQQIVCVTPRLVDTDLVEARDRDLAGRDIVQVEGGQDVPGRIASAATLGEARSSANGFDAVQAVEWDGAPGRSKAYQRDFWERNDYPASARFVVCDRELPARLPAPATAADADALTVELQRILEAADHREGTDWLRYWVSVLTLIMAQLSSDQLKPYRLYAIDVEMNFDGIRKVFDRRYAQWMGAREHVSEQMAGEQRQLTRSEYDFAQIPSCQTEITVDFDLVNTHDLMADDQEVGFVRDRPANDLAVWARQRRRIGVALATLLRAPRRALRNAARRFREERFFEPSQLEYCILNQTECEELVDDLAGEELRLAAGTGRRAFRLEAYDGALEARSQDVRDHIDLRSPAKLLVLCVALATAALVCGLMPYMVTMYLGEEQGLPALGTLACYLAVFAVVTLATLRWQQLAVRGAYEDFNTWMRGVLSTMRDEAKRLSDRISLYATFSRRWQLLERQHHVDDPTSWARWLGAKDGLLEARMREIEHMMAVEPDGEQLEALRDLPWSAVSALLDDESFYSVYSPRLVRVPFNAAQVQGLTVQVPFEFITSVQLDPVQIW